MPTKGLILATTLSIVIAATALQGYALAQPSNMYSSAKQSPSIPPPKVVFPSEEELGSYFQNMSIKSPRTNISDTSMGNVTNIQPARFDMNTYVAFQTKLNSSDHIFLSELQDKNLNGSFVYSNPIELTPTHHGMLSHLQIGAYNNKIIVAWQDYNSTSNLNSIYVSSSMESGKEFRTYQASANNTNAIDPVISSAADGLIFWKQAVQTPAGVIYVVEVYPFW
jgi:hypothetical protein